MYKKHKSYLGVEVNMLKRLICCNQLTKGGFGWPVRLPAVSVKTAVAVRLDTVAIL
ncbi:hypothetical protein Goshw_012256 [Gossypium schwendimanii]|uniref:Uncharacterized protein n=1 Tax=Gossypium schwendimanii TaxID=34291 RepID=A0A7J9KX85_GOSSC|nr:hypothetical protein [Gossypium schwendimanii]